MRKIIVLLIGFGISLNSFSQEKNIEVSKEFSYFEKMSSPTFKIGVGLFIPKNNGKNYFGVSPLIELGVVFPKKKGKSLEFAVQLVIPNQKENFLYQRTVDVVRAKSTFITNLLVKFKKDIYSDDKIDFNFGLGIGASIVTTNARNPFYEGNEDQEKYESIKSLLISPGFEYVRKFNSYDQLSISFYVQISPYKVEGALQESIGRIFYIPKISYSF